MRLIVELEATENHEYTSITNIELQGTFYNLLKDTRFHNLHDGNGFKFFTFSNLYPPTNYKKRQSKQWIVSSPNKKLIKTLYYRLKTLDSLRLSKYILKIKSVENVKFSKNKLNTLKTNTPIVLYKNNEDYTYFSMDQGDLDFFFSRIKDNALKKYNAFYNDEYSFEGPLFDSFSFYKEVAHSLQAKTHRFLVIGTLWNELKAIITKENEKFYNFIYETGLGEKNGLGYGLLSSVI